MDEFNGVDYYFVDKEEFESMADNGKFAEWAKVHGNFYGTPMVNIKDANESGS